MEEPLQIATTNVDTNVVSALMDGPLQIDSRHNTDVMSGAMEEPMQIVIANTDANIVSMSIEEGESTPTGHDPNNLFGGLRKHCNVMI